MVAGEICPFSYNFKVNKTAKNSFVGVDSLSSVLQEFYIPELEPVISVESFNYILNFTKHFPKWLTQFFGYEINLNSNNRESDFLICINEPERFNKFIRNNSPLHQKVFDPATTKRFANFSDYWSNDKTGAGKKINNIWFEFDYSEIKEKLPRLSFFFGPRLDVNRLEMLLITERVFSDIFTKKVNPGTLKMLLRTYEILGNECFISQIGMMNARYENSLRLFIQGTHKNWIIPLLQKMNYTHSAHPDLNLVLNSCIQLSSKVDLDIDISEKIGNNIGLECYMNSTEQALTFLDFWVQKKLSSSWKSEQVKNFILTLKPVRNKSHQPFLSHFKIVFKPEDGFFIKVYLGYLTQNLVPKLIQTNPNKSD
jgi:hypothetical protein